MNCAKNDEVFPGVRRYDIVKHRSLGDAYQSLNNYKWYHFVFLGDHDDPYPFWVVDAQTATKLEKLGYERA